MELGTTITSLRWLPSLSDLREMLRLDAVL